MEVRVQKKKNKFPVDGKKLHTVWKILAVVLSICVLAGGIALWGRQEPALAADFNLEKNPNTGKYIFNVVEVVPEKQSAILGLFIKGEEHQTISIDKFEEFLNVANPNLWWAENYIYTDNKVDSNGNRPFSVEVINGHKKIVNNEIFKLYMLGIGVFDSSKSYYDNLKSTVNQNKLTEFDSKYELNYQIVTPDELDNMDLNKIQYIHFGGTTQISSYPQFYAQVGNGGSASDSGKTYNKDFSWNTALALYERAISDNSRMSVSMSAYQMVRLSHTWNIYKLYQMLHYFDDPSIFRETFNGGKLVTEYGYIDKSNGYMYVRWDTGNQWAEKKDWDDSYISQLDIKNYGHTGMLSHRQESNYIPEKYDNILLFNKSGECYFDNFVSTESVNKILKPGSSGGNPPEEPEDGSIKVLEIQPCNSYWLVDQTNLHQLAIAIDEDEDDISVTYVTPNTLNGMTVDLVAEYDLIVIGSNVDTYRNGTPYTEQAPYYHIGAFNDAVTLPTLLNGLLKKDYTTSEDFLALVKAANPNAAFSVGTIGLVGSKNYLWNAGIREQWGNNVKNYFLKNVKLELELHQNSKEEPTSRARFSGNDLTRYMQEQMAEFVQSGQPVVTTTDILLLSQKRLNILNGMEEEDLKEFLEEKEDARIYLGLGGIKDERDYFSNDKTVSMEYITEMQSYSWDKVKNTGKKIISLKKPWKPSVSIQNHTLQKDDDGNDILTIAEKGKKDIDLNSLGKTNAPTFEYQIQMPDGAKPEDCRMTIVIDRNGDGIFDEMGAGSSGKDGKKGSQNNATDTILNDQVFTYDFSELPSDSYDVDGQMLTGTYTAPEAVTSLEEFCEFRVIIHAKNNLLRGVWTGYLRPNVKQKNVKVLEITPYKTEKGKSLADNYQFKTYIEQLGTDREFLFDFNDGFDTILLYEFEQQCLEGTITAESLKQYDLIVVGTNFSSKSEDGAVDPREQKMAEVLKTYTDTLKRPIIFTNDSFSYVNSANYYSPIKQNYYFKDMTLKEGEKLKALNDPSLFDGINYRKVRLDATQYDTISGKNDELLKKQEDLDENMSGTVYLEPENKPLYEEQIQKGTYRALLYPLKTDLLPEDDRYAEDYTLGWNGLIFNNGTITVPGSYHSSFSGTKYVNVDLKSSEVAELLKKFGYVISSDNLFLWFNEYQTKMGYITEQEYIDAQTRNDTKSINIYVDAWWRDVNVLLKDFFFQYQKKVSLPLDTQVIPSTIPGYVLFDGKYLAEEVIDTFKEEYAYKWQMAVLGSGDDDTGSGKQTYTLSPVASSNHALYPEQNAWNYYLTQAMRQLVGMDRFSVTTDIERKKKRDYGSTYQYGTVEEIQGYTNGVLLEYAYIPPEGSPWSSILQTQSQYEAPELQLGTKPRTTYIDELNEGPIGQYPFKVMSDDDTKIAINENHAPYYQLDLERETGEGKIDDVTVWYTLTDTGVNDSSKYFEVSRKDAGNNYYLYSKGKSYYTGFSLCDILSEGESEKELVPEAEMKLFINTIYAALNGETEETAYYDTVLQEGGTVSGIEMAGDVGAPNRYTCYYDEYDEVLELSFRVQKINAADGETTPLTVGRKGEKGENGLPEVDELDETAYTLTGLPEENGVSNFPVVKVTGEPGTKGSLGSEVSDIWYTLRFNGDKGEGKIPDDMDGMTLIIGPKAAESKTLRPDSIYAEIRFVKRNLFELD